MCQLAWDLIGRARPDAPGFMLALARPTGEIGAGAEWARGRGARSRRVEPEAAL
jgi:hypothetical protein